MHLLVSLHPHIFTSLCSCVPACILASSYAQVHVPSLASLHPHILRLICVSLYPRIITSSYPQVHVCLLVSLHPKILVSSGSCVLVCIFTSLHRHILRFMCACLYPCILTSSYFQVHEWFLVYLHHHMLVASGLCANILSIQMNNCILASLSSLVLGNCAGQFVNNLQIFSTGQAFVLDFYRTSRKIYRRQPLRTGLKKSCY